MKKQLETITTAELDTSTGGWGFSPRWAYNHPYRAEQFLENHPRFEARWTDNHPYAAARLSERFGC
jgi:hypothetical protein